VLFIVGFIIDTGQFSWATDANVSAVHPTPQFLAEVANGPNTIILKDENKYAEEFVTLDNTIIRTTKDCVTSSYYPNTNLNGDALAVCYNEPEGVYMASLVYFDISSIPHSATINSAYLYLYCFFEPYATVLRIGRLEPRSWTETGVTWNNMPYGETPPPFQYFSVAPNVWNQYDVTEFVERWHSGTDFNNGFQLFTTTAGALAMFYCRETGSSWAPFLSITYTPLPPPPELDYPCDITISDETPTLDWYPVSGYSVDNYHVQVDDNPGFPSPYCETTTSYDYWTVSPPLPNPPSRRWYWQVRAHNAAGWGEFGQCDFLLMDLPPAPELVYPCDITIHDTTPRLSWYPVSGYSVDKYQVQVDDDDNFSSPERDTVTSDFYWTVSPPLPGYPQYWHWRVRAHNAIGWGQWADCRFLIMDVPPPPELNSPCDITIQDTTPTLDWDSVSGYSVDKYQVQVDDSSDFSSPERDTVTNNDDWTVSPPLPRYPRKWWYWRVRAHNAIGWGQWADCPFYLPVEEELDHTEIPENYVLLPNYPNPFNAVTEIIYALPENSTVNLSIYNLAGEKITTLVDEKQTAGYNFVAWDASDYSSGIYFYRLTAGDFTETKRMTLLK